MQTPKPKNSNNNELITHIVTQLKNNEEAYNIGAWENFNKKKKRSTIFWLRSAAAILLLGFTLFFGLDKNAEKTNLNYAVVKNNDVTNATKNAEKFASNNNKSVLTKNKDFKDSTNNNLIFTSASNKLQNASKMFASKNKQQQANNLAIKNQNITLKNPANYGTASMLSKNKLQNSLTHFVSKTKQKTNNLIIINKNTGLINDNPTDDYDTNLINNEEDVNKQTNINIIPVTINKLADSTTNSIKPKAANTKTTDFLATQAKIKQPLKGDKKASKWLLGLAIAPSFGNTQKLNMGYGLNMEYALSPKISINSGIAYNQLSATKNINGANNFADASSIKSLVANVKNLESVSANISGIDIPLEIKYNLNNSIYANVGISAFAIINQQRSNSYIEEKLVTQLTTTFAGEQQENNFLVYERSTQSVFDNQTDNLKFLAFYNFSIGFKQKIAKKKFVGLEPFVKLPVKEITTDRLRLIGTGLRLKFDF